MRRVISSSRARVVASLCVKYDRNIVWNEKSIYVYTQTENAYP